MTSSSKINLVLFIAFGVSNYWAFGNAASTVQKRSYYENDDLNGYAAVLDTLDNSVEVEMESESEGATTCAPPPRDFRRITNEIQRRIQFSVGCQPRPEIVNLHNDDPRAALIPNVAVVKRCQGFCYGGPLSNCQAVPESIKLRKVTVLKVLRHEEPHCESLHEVEVEEHEECQCERVFFIN